MKKIILSAAVVLAALVNSSAQTKGTNTIGVGFGFNSGKTEAGDIVSFETDGAGVSLGYGNFIKDNVRFGIEGNYFSSKSGRPDLPNSATENKSFGGGVSLQRYYPLLKKFYAYAGGNASYTHSKYKSVGSNFDQKGNSIFLGVSGGATYFLSRRFAFEANLLAGGLNYNKTKSVDGEDESTSASLNLSTTGAITNMGFKVYILF